MFLLSNDHFAVGKSQSHLPSPAPRKVSSWGMYDLLQEQMISDDDHVMELYLTFLLDVSCKP